MCFNLLYTAFKIYHLKNSMECDCNFLGVFSAKAMFSQLLQLKNHYRDHNLAIYIDVSLDGMVNNLIHPNLFSHFQLAPKSS